MAIQSICPRCASRYNLDEKYSGKTVRCPRCQETFQVPAERLIPPPLPDTFPPQERDLATTGEDAHAYRETSHSPRSSVPPPLPRDRRDDDIDALETPDRSIAKEPPAAAKKPSLLMQGIGIVAGIFGMVLGRFVGLPMLIVAFFGFVVGMPLYFLTSGRRRNMVPAGATQAGHALWMLMGAVLLATGFAPGITPSPWLFVEGGLFLLGGILVVLWPSLIVILLLTVYQVGMFVLNLLTLIEGVPTEMGKALLLHLFLRVFAVSLMFEAYFRKPQEENGVEEEPPARAY